MSRWGQIQYPARGGPESSIPSTADTFVSAWDSDPPRPRRAQRSAALAGIIIGAVILPPVADTFVAAWDGDPPHVHSRAVRPQPQALDTPVDIPSTADTFVGAWQDPPQVRYRLVRPQPQPPDTPVDIPSTADTFVSAWEDPPQVRYRAVRPQPQPPDTPVDSPSTADAFVAAWDRQAPGLRPAQPRLQPPSGDPVFAPPGDFLAAWGDIPSPQVRRVLRQQPSAGDAPFVEPAVAVFEAAWDDQHPHVRRRVPLVRQQQEETPLDSPRVADTFAAAWEDTQPRPRRVPPVPTRSAEPETVRVAAVPSETFPAAWEDAQQRQRPFPARPFSPDPEPLPAGTPPVLDFSSAWGDQAIQLRRRNPFYSTASAVTSGASPDIIGAPPLIHRIPVMHCFPWQLQVLGQQTAPPAAPAKGNRYVVTSVATGTWTGHEDTIAWYDGFQWQFDAPDEGWATYDLGASVMLHFDGANWITWTIP